MPEGKSSSFCGSIAYLAPEMLRRQAHSHMLDLYGLGVLLYEMLVGLPPFYTRDREQLFRNITTEKLTFPDFVSAAPKNLITKLMDRNPERRLGRKHTKEVRSHEFFDGISMNFTYQSCSLSVPEVLFCAAHETMP